MANTTWTQYYEVINSSTAAVAPGAAVSFSQDGNQFLGSQPSNQPVRVNDTTFALGSALNGDGWWRVAWQIPVGNSGQLALQNGSSLISETVVGTSWGHSQIVGDFILRVPYQTTQNISLVNPMANNSSLNLLSAGSGNIDVVVSIIFECFGD